MLTSKENKDAELPKHHAHHAKTSRQRRLRPLTRQHLDSLSGFNGENVDQVQDDLAHIMFFIAQSPDIDFEPEGSLSNWAGSLEKCYNYVAGVASERRNQIKSN